MMRILLAVLLFTNLSFAQISNDQINVNVLGGSISLTGSSAVTQSGTWNVGLSTGANVIGSISNSSFGITGALPAGSNAIGSITNTVFSATQSGVWSTGRTWALASSTDSTSAVITSMPAITGSVSITGTPTIANTAFGINGSLPAGSNAIGSITNTIFSSTQSGIWNVGLSTGSNVIGSISNTGFGITGTLPAFASTPTFNIGTGAFVDRTTAVAPYAQRLSDGSAFYDARSIRSLTSADVVTIANPTTTVTANIGTTNGLALDTSVNSLLKPASTLAAVTTVSAVTAITNALPTGTNSIGQVTTNAGTNTSTAALALQTTQSTMNANMTNGTAKTQVVDSANNTIASISDGNGTKALEVAIGATSFVFSSVNSSTTQLAAGATFAGAVETVVNQQSSSILLTSDQNGTLVFTEYIDAGGTRVSRTTTVSIIANVPYSRSFVINGNYFKASFTNNGGATTTTFNLNTAYGTIPSATALGNGQVSLDEVNGLAFSTSLKGVQATNYLPVQMPHNSGRVSKMYSSVFTAATTEALVTLTPIADGTAGTNATSFTVTSGKKLRIQQVCVSTRNAGAAGQGVVIQLRMTSTGAVTAASPLVGTIATGSNLAIANSANSDCMVMPDGFELSGTQQFGVSQIGTATANNTVVVYGFEY